MFLQIIEFIDSNHLIHPLSRKRTARAALEQQGDPDIQEGTHRL